MHRSSTIIACLVPKNQKALGPVRSPKIPPPPTARQPHEAVYGIKPEQSKHSQRLSTIKVCAWVLSCLVWFRDLQFRGPCSLFPLPPVPVTKVCCHSVCVRSKANIRYSVTPYFSLFYFRTSAGTGGLCKAKAGRGGEEKERGLWPMG